MKHFAALLLALIPLSAQAALDIYWAKPDWVNF
jgi:hypothetical protein